MKREEKHSQSQNFNNSVILGSQIGQGLKDVNQQYTTQRAGNSKIIDPTDIIKLVEEIQRILKNSNVPGDMKGKCENYLQTFKSETQEKDPDKNYAAHSLQKFIHEIHKTKNTTIPDTAFIDKVQPLITRIIPWLGEERKFIKL